jgi:hypothetical protein
MRKATTAKLRSAPRWNIAALEYKCDEVAAFLRKHGGKE